jgi:hypothetical protein
MGRVNEALGQFIKVEHYRLHCAEEWTDSPYKQAVIASACAKLERLEAAALAAFQRPVCMVCESRKAQGARVLQFPSRPEACQSVLPRAA